MNKPWSQNYRAIRAIELAQHACKILAKPRSDATLAGCISGTNRRRKTNECLLDAEKFANYTTTVP